MSKRIIKKSDKKLTNQFDLDIIIRLQIDGKVIEVPYDKAKNLYKQLEKIFGVVNIPDTPIPPIVPQPYEPYKPCEPWIKEKKRPWEDKEIFCKLTTINND